MPLVLLENYRSASPVLCGTDGPPMQPGDSAILYLDTTETPAFPDSITATVVLPLGQVTALVGICQQTFTTYNFEYDTDDLEGAKPFLEPEDVLQVECTTCCEVLGTRVVAAEAQVAALTTQVDTLQNTVDAISITVANPTANYAGLPGDDFILANPTSSTFAVTWPNATLRGGKPTTVKNIATSGSEVINLNTGFGQTLDGAFTLEVLNNGDSITAVPFNGNWYIIERYIA